MSFREWAELPARVDLLLKRVDNAIGYWISRPEPPPPPPPSPVDHFVQLLGFGVAVARVGGVSLRGEVEPGELVRVVGGAAGVLKGPS